MATRNGKETPEAATPAPEVDVTQAVPGPPASEEVAEAQAKVDGIGQEDELVNPAQHELKKTVDEANDKGFYGVKVDPTDNSAYTVGGVTAGKPTPETDRGNA